MCYGILRLIRLAYTVASVNQVFYIIVIAKREKDVCFQLSRPAIKQNNVVINTCFFQNYAAIAMRCAGLAKAIILWKRLRKQYDLPQCFKISP